MNPVSEGLETCVIGGIGEARRVGDEDAVLIPEIFASLEGAAEGVLHIPALVDDGVLPAELADAGEDGGIGAEVGFADGEAIGVPAVPAHGGGGGRVLGESNADGAGEKAEREEQDRAGSEHVETYNTTGSVNGDRRWERATGGNWSGKTT